MIADPLNDHACLGRLTDMVRDLVQKRDPAFVDLAEKVGTPEGLILYLRSLPQRDDEGDPNDGPRTDACTPSQRVRLSPIPPNPNCFERSGIFVGVAELLDPEPVRQLKTANTPAGLHTYPVENHTAIHLDPAIPRNALQADLFQSLPAGATFTTREAIDWLLDVAEEPAARDVGGLARVQAAAHAIDALLAGEPIDQRAIDDIAYTCARALREAPMFGAVGVTLWRETVRALGARMPRYAAPIVGPAAPASGLRNKLSLQIGKYTVSPNWDLLGRLGRVGVNVGTDVGLAALQMKLATMGITPPVMSVVEHELNREGLSLGRMAPRAPSLAALALLPKLEARSTASTTAAARAATSPTTLAAPSAAQALRNRWFPTPKESLAEMNLTNQDILALGRDIRSSFRRPFEQQFEAAVARFEQQHGRAPDDAKDFAEIYGSMSPKPTPTDIQWRSYQGDFVHNFGEFEREWQAWYAANSAWSDRLFGVHDTALDYRDRAAKWREQFLALGGTTHAPAPQMPRDTSLFGDVGSAVKTAALVAGGAVVAAVVLPPLLRRSQNS